MKEQKIAWAKLRKQKPVFKIGAKLKYCNGGAITNGQNQIQPPAVKRLIDAEIDEIKNTLLKLKYPCHI